MSIRGVDVKVGDKLRYLGGDESNFGSLKAGMVYPVIDIEEDGTYVIEVEAALYSTWLVGKDDYNSGCFELVDDSEEESSDNKTALDLIANLAQEVAQLKRELSELRGDVQSQAYEDNERIDRILDDIVMLDERTQGGATIEPMPVRKVVYEYDRYYD